MIEDGDTMPKRYLTPERDAEIQAIFEGKPMNPPDDILKRVGEIIADRGEACTGNVPCCEECDCLSTTREIAALLLGSGVIPVPENDVQEAVDLLGGFMGSVSGFRQAEALRDRLRAALPRS
jgi:hypothetical protein